MPNNVVNLDDLFGGGGGSGGGGGVVDLDSAFSSPAPARPHLGRATHISPRKPSMLERIQALASDIWHVPGRMADSAANYYSDIPTPLPGPNDEEYQGQILSAPNDIPAAQLAAEALVPEEDARKSYLNAAHRAALDLILPFGTDPMNAAVGIGLQNAPSAVSRLASAGFGAVGARGASEQAKAAQREYEAQGMTPEFLREAIGAAGNAGMAVMGARHSLASPKPVTPSTFMQALNESLNAPRDMSPRLNKPMQGPAVPPDFSISLPETSAQPTTTLSPRSAGVVGLGDTPSRLLPENLEVSDVVGTLRPGTQSMADRLRVVDAQRRVADMEARDQNKSQVAAEGVDQLQGQELQRAVGMSQRIAEADQKAKLQEYRRQQELAQLEANVPSFIRNAPQAQAEPKFTGNRGAYQDNTTSGIDTLIDAYSAQGAPISRTSFGSEYLTAPDGAILIRHVGADGVSASASIGPDGVVSDMAAIESKRGTSAAGRLLYSIGELGGRAPAIEKMSPDTYAVLSKMAGRMGTTIENIVGSPDILRDIVAEKLARRRGNAGGNPVSYPEGVAAEGGGVSGTGAGEGVLGPGDPGPAPALSGVTRELLNPEPRAQSVEQEPIDLDALLSGVRDVGPLDKPGAAPDLSGVADSIGSDPASSYPGAVRRAVTPQEDILRQIPGVGESLYSHIQKYRTRADTLAGQGKAAVLRATQGFTSEDWSSLIAAMNAGQYEGLRPEVQRAIQVIRGQVLEPLWNLAESAGATDVSRRENFFPSMKKGGDISAPRPEPGFGQEKLKGASVASLEQSRNSDVSDLIQTPQVLDRYINDVAHRIAQAEVMGPDMERVGNLIKDLPTDQRNYAQKAFKRATNTEYVDETGRMLGKVRRAKAVVALPFAGATQYGQTVPIAASGGMGNTVKALSEMMSNFPEAQARAYESGALSPTLSGETLATNTGTSAGLYGIGTADMHMRVLANETGLKLAAQQGLTGQDAINFAREFANKTQYRTEAEKLPQWATSPLGKTVTQFMPFGYRHAIYLRDMVSSGNGAQVARYLALAPVVGYAVAAVKAGMKGYDPEDLTMLDALRASGGGGAWEDLLNRVMSRDPALGLAGPVAENAHDLVNAFASGDPAKAAAGAAASVIPGFGGQISREILAGNDESKLPGRPGWVGRLRDFAQDRPSGVRETNRALADEQAALRATRAQVDDRYPKAPSSATLTPTEKLGRTRTLKHRAEVVNAVLDELARGDVPAARRLLAKARREGFHNLTLENIMAGRDTTSDTAP
jgi:hypothetical protein